MHPNSHQARCISFRCLSYTFAWEHGSQGAVPQGSLLHIHLLVHVHSCRNWPGHPSLSCVRNPDGLATRSCCSIFKCLFPEIAISHVISSHWATASSLRKCSRLDLRSRRAPPSRWYKPSSRYLRIRNISESYHFSAHSSAFTPSLPHSSKLWQRICCIFVWDNSFVSPNSKCDIEEVQPMRPVCFAHE